jgi:hypothetical protein
MRNTMSLAAAVGAIALGAAGVPSANAADISVPYQQGQAPGPQYYGPPPVVQGYAYLPPPPYYVSAPPPFAVFPGPYYARGPYWGGYGPRFAYGYGRWGYGRWGYRR